MRECIEKVKQNHKILLKYVYLNDFPPPENALENRRKIVFKKAPSWLPKPGFQRISRGPPILKGFEQQIGHKMLQK